MRTFWLFVVAALTGMLVSAELRLSLPILGVGPDLAIVVVAAFAMHENPRAAALSGFAVGLFRDLLLTTPTGLSALAYALTAYAVALVGPLRQVWAFVAMIAGATFVSQLTHGLGIIVLGGQNLEAWPIPRVVILTTAYNSLLAPLLMPVLKRIVPAEGVATGSGAE